MLIPRRTCRGVPRERHGDQGKAILRFVGNRQSGRRLDRRRRVVDDRDVVERKLHGCFSRPHGEQVERISDRCRVIRHDALNAIDDAGDANAIVCDSRQLQHDQVAVVRVTDERGIFVPTAVITLTPLPPMRESPPLAVSRTMSTLGVAPVPMAK